jgi:hypothetical protein
VPPPLEFLSLCRPVHKPLKMLSVFPRQLEKLPGVQVRGLFPQKSFKSPAHVWAFPRIESVAASRVPVIRQCLKHVLRHGRIARPSLFRLFSGCNQGMEIPSDRQIRASLASYFPRIKVPPTGLSVFRASSSVFRIPIPDIRVTFFANFGPIHRSNALAHLLLAAWGQKPEGG